MTSTQEKAKWRNKLINHPKNQDKKKLDTVGRKEDFVRKQFKFKFTGKSRSSFFYSCPKIFQNHRERISKHFQKHLEHFQTFVMSTNGH